jgi:site-specific DNA recombinase
MAMKAAAIYARVSSDKQRQENTIASQTAALIDFAHRQGYRVPDEWVFEDEGYSGANLLRPGLERIRDLAAEGQLDAVLVHAPDRLSRKYAYQILLIEEFARQGVETIFIKAPQTATPEDRLLLQFQGMIAEYERAQILERSRRGKRHRARQGEVSVLSGAPYGYCYVPKSDEAAALYEIIETEAGVVRMVYDRYTVQGMSIGAITRLLNEQGVPTRKRISRWERSTVWAMLRNPAYKGTACFGKTTVAQRQRITRSLRLRGGIAARDSASHERPRSDWIEIPVPAIVGVETFAIAQELLQGNKIHAPRRTIEPSVVQGLVSCRKCGYALSRTSTRSSARKIHYYRCIGSDAWRRLGGPVCDSRPVRQDLLDHVVWNEILRLLEDPQLIQEELDRRLAAARTADPMRQREKILQRDLTRLCKTMDRLLTAYQEDLLSLDELRRRMPELRRREHAAQTELRSLIDQVNDRAACLRLAETLSAFLARLRDSVQTLDVQERQRIVRLLVKEILVGDDTIIIRHSIPIPSEPPHNDTPPSPPSQSQPSAGQSYLSRSGRNQPNARQHLHEPVLETLAADPTRRSLPGARRRLCRRLRHPQSRARGRGAGVDAGSDDEAWAHPQRGQNLGEECPNGTLRLPWLFVRTAPLREDWPTVSGRKPVQEKRRADQGKGERTPGSQQHGCLARGARSTEPAVAGLVGVFRLWHPDAGVPGYQSPRLRSRPKLPAQTAQYTQPRQPEIWRCRCIRHAWGAAASTRACCTVVVSLTMKLVGKPDAGNPPVRLCVQRRLVCSAGVKPAGARVRCPVAGMAGWRETKTLKPIDKISFGEIASHRAVTKVNAQVASKVSEPEGRARNRRAKAAWGAEI